MQSQELVWSKVFEAWTDLLNQLIRGYQNYGFEAWTLPCLYIVSKNLRAFAIQADNERNSSSVEDTTANNFQDDFDPETNKNKKLEECVRTLTKVFNLCQADRCVPPERRPSTGLAYSLAGHRLMSLGNGVVTTSPTSFSKHTSSSTRRRYPNISSTVCEPAAEICQTSRRSQNPSV
jgi:hypothetical protein